MASRSTRQKIRDQAGKMINSNEAVLEHLKSLNDLADGRSTFIKAHTPLIIELQDAFEYVLRRFRDGL